MKLPAYGLFLCRALLDPNQLLTLDCSTLTTGSAYFFCTVCCVRIPGNIVKDRLDQFIDAFRSTTPAM